MKKKIIKILIVIIAVILFIPIPFRLRDGGSIELKALLYTITKYHKLAPIDENVEGGYIDGIGIKILGMEIYNSTNKIKVNSVDEKQDNKNGIYTNEQDDSSFIGTVLEETTTYMIVAPNEDEV